MSEPPPPLAEWTEEQVVAVASLAIALEMTSSPSFETTLAAMNERWSHSCALELQGHTFDDGVNVATSKGAAPRPASGADVHTVALQAWSYAEQTLSLLHRGTPALPVFGLDAGGCLLALLVMPLFVAIGVPVGLVASALTDWWMGEGIHRGIVQCACGLWNDACTVRIAVGGGASAWVDLFERLLVDTDEPLRAPGRRLHSQRFAELHRLVGERRARAGQPPARPLFDFAPSDSLWQVPAFDEALWRGTFPRRARACLQISGGGLRDHNFEVAELQDARRAYQLLAGACELRYQLRALGSAPVAQLWSLLPERARGCRVAIPASESANGGAAGAVDAEAGGTPGASGPPSHAATPERRNGGPPSPPTPTAHDTKSSTPDKRGPPSHAATPERRSEAPPSPPTAHASKSGTPSKRAPPRHATPSERRSEPPPSPPTPTVRFWDFTTPKSPDRPPRERKEEAPPSPPPPTMEQHAMDVISLRRYEPGYEPPDPSAPPVPATPTSPAATSPQSAPPVLVSKSRRYEPGYEPPTRPAGKPPPKAKRVLL